MMSTAAPLVTVPPAAERAGADLREARERLGLSLRDVALSLRIRLPHLESLEEGRISTLPGNAYALAFVRTYAGFVGLDAEEMVRRFKTEAAEVSRRTELVFPIPMPERGLPAGAVLLLGVVLAIGAYVGWYRLSGDGRLPAEAITAIPERLAPLAEQALPPNVTPGSGPVADGPKVDVNNPMTAATLGNPAPPVVAISPGSAAAAQVYSRPGEFSGAPGPVPDATRVVLRANADSWLLVKDREGTILLNRVLKAGETWPAPGRSDLLLTTGNAGGTDVVLDGAAIPSLGGAGTVRRDLPLDPDAIKDGRLAAALTPPIAPVRAHQ